MMNIDIKRNCYKQLKLMQENGIIVLIKKVLITWNNNLKWCSIYNDKIIIIEHIIIKYNVNKKVQIEKQELIMNIYIDNN